MSICSSLEIPWTSTATNITGSQTAAIKPGPTRAVRAVSERKITQKTGDRRMATDRKFCRFARSVPEDGSETVYTTAIPEGGLCLSSFVVLTDGGRVLMGHLDPKAPWDHIGALDSGRAAAHSKGWMLPSSHLMLYESPKDAAQRILAEQLGLEGVHLSEPMVVAEVGTPRRFPGLLKHWDFEFIFRGQGPAGSPPRSGAWTELRYIDTKATPRKEIARSHDEVLESAGFQF